MSNCCGSESVVGFLYGFYRGNIPIADQMFNQKLKTWFTRSAKHIGVEGKKERKERQDWWTEKIYIPIYPM